MDRVAAEILRRVFMWGYENGIDVEILVQREFDGVKWPEIRFRRNGKAIAYPLHPLTHLEAKLKHIWENVALELCVTPLDLSDLEEAL